jgi:hypothetical protein
MEYTDLEHGQQFIENGFRYIVVKNVSHFLRFHCPVDDYIIVFRPMDNGLTFRFGYNDKITLIEG